MAYLTFVLTVLFVPFFASGATVPRWGMLAIAVPVIMLWREVPIPKSVWVAAIYFALTLLISPNIYDGLGGYFQFLFLLGVFCIGRTLTDMRPVFLGAALGFTVNSAAIAAQYLGLDIPHISENAGLFMNRNSAVEAAAMVVAALVFYRAWYWIPGVLPTLFAGERAAIVALGAAGVIAVWGKSRLLAAVCVAVVSLLVLALWARMDFSTGSINERLDVWRDLVPNLNLLGHGIGSFDFSFPAMQVHTNALHIRFDHPHFEALQILYEFGVVGGVFIAWFLYRLSGSERSAVWYALVVFLVEGCFAFPLYMPVTGFLAALCAGWLSSSRDSLRYGVPVVGGYVPSWRRKTLNRAF